MEFVLNICIFCLQNRHNYSQLPGDVKAPLVKVPAVRVSGKGRGKVEAKLASKDANMESSSAKEKVSGIQDTFKSFCIRFVRLNGILFTRTRYTFSETYSLLLLTKFFWGCVLIEDSFLQPGDFCQCSFSG